MDLDHTLCYCYHITKRKIVNFVKQTRPRRASQISECFQAGSGCGWCIPFLTRIHEEVVEGQAVKADDITPEEYEARRADYRKGVAAGERARNSYANPAAIRAGESAGGVAARVAGSVPAAEKAGKKEEEFDYTRYFSRSRPDPEPETLE